MWASRLHAWAQAIRRDSRFLAAAGNLRPPKKDPKTATQAQPTEPLGLKRDPQQDFQIPII